MRTLFNTQAVIPNQLQELTRSLIREGIQAIGTVMEIGGR